MKTFARLAFSGAVVSIYSFRAEKIWEVFNEMGKLLNGVLPGALVRSSVFGVRGRG